MSISAKSGSIQSLQRRGEQTVVPELLYDNDGGRRHDIRLFGNRFIGRRVIRSQAPIPPHLSNASADGLHTWVSVDGRAHHLVGPSAAAGRARMMLRDSMYRSHSSVEFFSCIDH